MDNFYPAMQARLEAKVYYDEAQRLQVLLER
jgi:hypothetical protein